MKKELSELEKKLAYNKFQDIYNPMKPYALLLGMGINKEKSQELASWYEDVFYEQIMNEYERIKK